MQNKKFSLKYLALGDSYTIGENVPKESNVPVQLVNQFRQKGLPFAYPDVIAKTGWNTEDLLKAILKQKPEEDYDLVSLLIGVNNQYRKKPIDIYKKEFNLLMQKSISLTAGDDPGKVLVISIPDYGYTPFGETMQQEISRELDEYNAVNKKVADKYGAWYVDIIDISRRSLANTDLIAEDKLHPSALQYKLWAERIIENEEFVDYLLQNKQ
jgi:lysophospholipase L1-like esterase